MKITLKQLTNLFKYLQDDTKQATFRYLIYEVMGFKPKDYCDLYYTGLMSFKDMIYELRDENTRLKRIIKKLRKRN